MKKCPANRHINKCKDGYIIEIPTISSTWIKNKKGEIMTFKTLDEARRFRNIFYKI